MSAVAPPSPAQRASWRRRLGLYVSMLRYGSAHNRDFAREHFAFFERLRADVRRHLGELEGLRVLEVGCGKMMWLSLLLHSCGARVTGFDTEWSQPRATPAKYWRIGRTSGAERALRTLVWDALYARPYYRELAAVSPFALRFEGLDCRRMSVTELDFAADTFDLVVSHEVFEHLPDVHGALEAVSRVLRPEGLTYIYTHSFTSLSGGHHIAWKYPDREPSTTVPPWDHLRERRFPEIPSWINGWREAQYRQAFERRFEIVEWLATEREGEALLTPEIEAELADYGRDELLIKGFITLARPR
ncbi:MAG: methyltransferase domain-containing protein [Acidobacteriota bacterium]